MPATPELEDALAALLDKMHDSLTAGGFRDTVDMYLAGGAAVNYYCGTRYTEDVDASFSRRPLLDFSEMVVRYKRADGTAAMLYLDPNYNTAFALLHENFEVDALEWHGIGNERRCIRLHVLTPVDLAVSKISRFTDQDRADILDLADRRLFTAETLKQRAEQALGNYIGNLAPVRSTIERVCAQVAEIQRGPRQSR